MNGVPSRSHLGIALLSALTIVLAGIPAGAAAAPPVLTVPGAQTVNESQLLTFLVSATDADGQIVELSAAFLPPGSSFVDLTGRSRHVRSFSSVNAAGSSATIIWRSKCSASTPVGYNSDRTLQPIDKASNVRMLKPK